MKMIRTTVSLPENIYQQLRIKAVAEKKTLSEALTEQITGVKSIVGDEAAIEKRVEEAFALFKKVGRWGKKIDLVKALREDRDRDNA